MEINYKTKEVILNSSEDNFDGINFYGQLNNIFKLNKILIHGRDKLYYENVECFNPSTSEIEIILEIIPNSMIFPGDIDSNTFFDTKGVAKIAGVPYNYYFSFGVKDNLNLIVIPCWSPK